MHFPNSLEKLSDIKMMLYDVIHLVSEYHDEMLNFHKLYKEEKK